MKLFVALPLLVLLSSINPVLVHTQYKWTTYSGDPNFQALEDDIDKGRILYHKSAQNNLTSTGNRGLVFDTTLFAFPSLTGSFAWSQVRVNVGKISFYPHIFTFDKGTSSFAIAILYNISRVSPVRGVRTRPSFTPTSLLQLEKEKMNFTRLKFLSEGFETELVLQVRNQETELNLSDYDINYNYWVKSSPTQKEAMGLRTFFARPITSFKMRAYSDKGYLDTTLKGAKVKELGEIFVSTVDLYQRLIDPNYINRKKSTNTNAKKTNTAAKPKVAQRRKRVAPTNAQAAARRRQAVARRRQVARRKQAAARRRQAAQRKVVTTNRRPKTTRVVKPR